MSLSPSDQHTPHSSLSWPLLHSPTPSPALHSSPPLSSPASMGAFSAKVTKRKSRAVTKPPIRVFSADRASFRDIVQKLTGIPTTSPSIQARQRLYWGADELSGISRPVMMRPGLQNDGMVAAHQGMPTLDSSSPYLARGYCSNSMGYNEVVGKSKFNSPYEANFDLNRAQPEANFDLNGCGGGATLPGQYIEGGMGMSMDMESLRQLHRASELESLLLGSSKMEEGNKMDQWLFSDLLRTPSPKVEAQSF